MTRIKHLKGISYRSSRDMLPIIRAANNQPILQILNSVCPGWQAEYRFHPVRKWRFDYAHEMNKLAIEIEGGTWIKGRHVRGYGYRQDMEKYNAAVLSGWKMLRYAPDQIGQMVEDVGKLVGGI